MTKKNVEITLKDRKMLDLLAVGASNKLVAKKLGYREGTTRVYLHNLYRKLGVANKTNAVIWYLDQLGKPAQPQKRAVNTSSMPIEESIGEMALRTNLLTALGVMSLFLGSYSRVWAVAARLKGTRIDEAAQARRVRSRLLWEALLRGDSPYGKALHDQGAAEALAVDSPSDCVLLALLLLIGRHSIAADQVIDRLGKRGASGISPNERLLLGSLREVMQGNAGDALRKIHGVAAEAAAQAPTKHLAMVTLFVAYQALGDRERAVNTAEAIWAEAEVARQHLQAMGERPFRSASLPEPLAISPRRKEKAAIR